MNEDGLIECRASVRDKRIIIPIVPFWRLAFFFLSSSSSHNSDFFFLRIISYSPTPPIPRRRSAVASCFSSYFE